MGCSIRHMSRNSYLARGSIEKRIFGTASGDSTTSAPVWQAIACTNSKPAILLVRPAGSAPSLCHPLHCMVGGFDFFTLEGCRGRSPARHARPITTYRRQNSPRHSPGTQYYLNTTPNYHSLIMDGITGIHALLPKLRVDACAKIAVTYDNTPLPFDVPCRGGRSTGY